MLQSELSQESFQERNFGFPLNEISQRQFIDYIFEDFSGHLCLSVKNKQGTLWNVFYKKSEQRRMEKYLANIYGNDTYISYSTYYRGDKKFGATRKQENIAKTYMLVQDLDYYKDGMSDADVLQQLHQKIKQGELLMPNIILFTGRGYQLITVVKAFKNIQGYANDQKWRKIQEHQIEVLNEFRSDTVVKNPSALTRLPDSKNRKAQNKVYAFLAKEKKYELDDIIAFYKLNPQKKQRSNNGNQVMKKSKNKINQNPKKLKYLFNTYTLNRARVDDIFTYVHIKNKRKEDYIGIRNKLALILRFHSLIVNGGDYFQAEEDVKKLIEKIDRTETSEEELLRRSRGAERHYQNWIAGTWNKNKYIQGGLFYTNQTLVEIMGIQDDYLMQVQLQTIKIRDKEYEKQRMRLKRDSVSRETYDWERQRNKRKALELRKQKKTYKEIARTLGVSINTVKYYFRKH